MMKIRGYILLTPALLLLFYCGSGRGKQERQIRQKSDTPEITAERPKKEMIELVIESTGTFYPFEESNVAFEVDGKIVEISKDLGDFVKKGELLARISTEEYALKKAQSEADLKNAEAEYRRIQELYEKKFATEQQLDAARRNLNVAKAQFDLASKKLSDCSLRSPISGFVARRVVNAGEYVRTGSTAFYVVNTSVLKFNTEISERYSSYVKIKDRVVIQTANAYEIEGYVYRISPAVNVDSRAFILEVKVENGKNLIKPGSFGKAKVFPSYKYTALTISEDAITYFSGTPRVFKIKDSKVIEQVITIKERVGKRLVVESGLNEDDLIATSLVSVLTNNQNIKLRE
ncbi:MAG: efflux RND transporter periplasmic adaptor subunit [Myxococcota bacterium]